MNHEHDPLSEERIEAMRSNVMARISKPRARSATFRSALGAAAVVSAVSLVGVGYVLGANNPAGHDMSASDETTLFQRQGTIAGEAESMDTAGKTLGAEPNAAEPEHVIITGSVHVEVKSPTSAATKLRGTIRDLGGHIDSESQFSDDADTMNLTVRIPRNAVESFSDAVAGLGNVTDTSIDRVQVTQQVKDVDARIEALKVSTARLQAIMKEAKNTSDLLEAESRLAQRQAELEGLVAQRKGLSDQTEMATISVTLTQASAAGTVNPGGFKGGLISGWNSLVDVVNAGVAGLGFILPWLVPFALLAWGIRWFVRRRR